MLHRLSAAAHANGHTAFTYTLLDALEQAPRPAQVAQLRRAPARRPHLVLAAQTAPRDAASRGLDGLNKTLTASGYAKTPADRKHRWALAPTT